MHFSQYRKMAKKGSEAVDTLKLLFLLSRKRKSFNNGERTIICLPVGLTQGDVRNRRGVEKGLKTFKVPFSPSIISILVKVTKAELLLF